MEQPSKMGQKKTVIPRGEITPLIGVIYNPKQTHLFEAICSFFFSIFSDRRGPSYYSIQVSTKRN